MEISSSLSLFLPEAAAPLWGAETGWVQSSAAAPEFFWNFLDAVESLPPLSSSVTQTRGVPCQCHQVWLCLWFIHCGIHQDLPVNVPFVQSLGYGIPSWRMRSSCLEFTSIYLLMTLFFQSLHRGISSWRFKSSCLEFTRIYSLMTLFKSP